MEAGVVGSYCCAVCGLIYAVEGSLDDTFCPACGADRGLQGLVLCSRCCMPMVPGSTDTWGHTRPTPCGGSSPLPLVGMRTQRGRVSRVTPGGGEVRRRVDSRHPIRFVLTRHGDMLVSSAGSYYRERLRVTGGPPPQRKNHKRRTRR